jgi:hypothetical protein
VTWQTGFPTTCPAASSNGWRCDAGAAGVLVTHEARHAAWADRVVFLRDGRVVDDTGRRDDAETLLPFVPGTSR